MFTVALSTTAKTSKQPENNCPSTEEQMKFVHAHNGPLLSPKKNGIMTLAAIFVHLSHNTKSVKDKYYVIPLIRRM